MPRFSEKSLVEDYIVEQLIKIGWKFVSSDELERDSLDEPLLVSNLIHKLQEINASLGIGDEEIKTVLNELKMKVSGVEGSKQVLNYLKSGVAVKFEKERVVKYVRLFDYSDIGKNEFIVSSQVSFGDGANAIRTDIILFVNGVPLVVIECKNPADFSTNWYDAFKQIKDYEKKVPELFKYVQIGVAAEQAVRYFPIVPWQDAEDVKTEEWKAEGMDPLDSILQMLDRRILLDVIRNFLFFKVEYGNATKIVARYMQYRASNKIVERVINNIVGKEDKNKGLIWHWQGSGKTLEMVFAANKLYHSRELENPSIFFIVDRVDLEVQLSEEFNALDIEKCDIIGSIDELRGVLKHDGGRGKRGLMITLIHKFRVEELDALKKELETLSTDNETILNRKNVITFIDEGHRTQYGTLAAQMRDILRSAFFFAFTGTPISKQGKDTYLAFSYPPEEKYLDKYFITDSIRDGFTVKIAYQPRLDKEVHLEKELLDTFLEIEDEELPEEIREDVKDKVKKKLNLIKVYLENPARVEKVAEDVAAHFKENTDGKFKAMVVAVNRQACVYYKRAMDKHLPKEYSEIVMTFDEKRDSQSIKDHFKELRGRYNGKELDVIKSEIIEKFKDEEFPKILIVTDMLLTGFDAPVLQTLYLDKPLKEHRLLQAIARTNRPYKGVKEAGLIIDYIGVLREVNRAFEIYTEEEIKGALSHIDDLKLEFIALIEEILDMFKDVRKDQTDRDTLLKAIEILTSDEENSREFIESYKKLRRVFELLGPDVIKAKRFSGYQWITAIYTYYLRLVLRNQASDQRYVSQYYGKTIKYIHKTTEFEELEKNLPIIEFDESYMTKLEEKVKTKEEKAANIVFTLNRFVLVEKHRNPIYESLIEKVERLLEMWKERTKDFEKIYNEGTKIFKEYVSLSRRKKDLNFSEMQYALLLILEKRFGVDKLLVDDVRELSKTLDEVIFPGWTSQTTAKKNVERIVRKVVRGYIKRYGLKLNELGELCEKLTDCVKNYGR
jgi:type I restriction enzyme R subunit